MYYNYNSVKVNTVLLLLESLWLTAGGWIPWTSVYQYMSSGLLGQVHPADRPADLMHFTCTYISKAHRPFEATEANNKSSTCLFGFKL